MKMVSTGQDFDIPQEEGKLLFSILVVDHKGNIRRVDAQITQNDLALATSEFVNQFVTPAIAKIAPKP